MYNLDLFQIWIRSFTTRHHHTRHFTFPSHFSKWPFWRNWVCRHISSPLHTLIFAHLGVCSASLRQFCVHQVSSVLHCLYPVPDPVLGCLQGQDGLEIRRTLTDWKPLELAQGPTPGEAGYQHPSPGGGDKETLGPGDTSGHLETCSRSSVTRCRSGCSWW